MCEQVWAPLCAVSGAAPALVGEMGLSICPCMHSSSLPTGDQWLVLPPRGGPGQDQAPEGGHEEAEAEHRCVPPQEYPRGCWQGLEEESLLCLRLGGAAPAPLTLCPYRHCSTLWCSVGAGISKTCGVGILAASTGLALPFSLTSRVLWGP